MVKIGIIDAASKVSGEIIRILINHPEVELVSLVSPENLGYNVSYIHHGLVGEQVLNFTDKFDPEEIDLLIGPAENINKINLPAQLAKNPELKVISLGKNAPVNQAEEEVRLGVSEANRKTLVRGSYFAYIPSNPVVTSLIGLSPLANFLLLNSDIEIKTTLPSDLAKSIDAEDVINELKHVLKIKQASFSKDINIDIVPSDSERAALTEINLKNTLPISEIEKIYDQIYDDHNFSFLTAGNIDEKEVEGTQKVVFNIEKPESDSLKIKLFSDARMRGAAGDVVHVMNLFFGLHEKTGLNLKPSRY